MGQQEVYTFLKQNRSGWFTSKEISNKLKSSTGSVTNCLKKLRDSSEIQHTIKLDKRGRKTYFYKFKK